MSGAEFATTSSTITISKRRRLYLIASLTALLAIALIAALVFFLILPALRKTDSIEAPSEFSIDEKPRTVAHNFTTVDKPIPPIDVSVVEDYNSNSRADGLEPSDKSPLNEDMFYVEDGRLIAAEDPTNAERN